MFSLFIVLLFLLYRKSYRFQEKLTRAKKLMEAQQGSMFFFSQTSTQHSVTIYKENLDKNSKINISTGCPKNNVTYSMKWFHVRAAPGGPSCATMSLILRAGFKCWHMKGVHVLARGGLSCATMYHILRAGTWRFFMCSIYHECQWFAEFCKLILLRIFISSWVIWKSNGSP